MQIWHDQQRHASQKNDETSGWIKNWQSSSCVIRLVLFPLVLPNVRNIPMWFLMRTFYGQGRILPFPRKQMHRCCCQSINQVFSLPRVFYLAQKKTVIRDTIRGKKKTFLYTFEFNLRKINKKSSSDNSNESRVNTSTIKFIHLIIRDYFGSEAYVNMLSK